ncbi:MAG: chemotaxis protein CheR [Betaproteobacteria bacterium]|nr:chemotaxis protein CheR [Betaproteobacteria bacterium]
MNRLAPLDDALLAGLREVLASRLGLHFPPERRGDLEKALASACRELGFPDASACARGLLSEPITQARVEILAGYLTVGETYFQRDARAFELLERHVIPELLRSRSEDNWQLRLWSAGCCTGEEPYTIAMLLDRALPASRKGNVTILATDVNPRFLAKAARGVYGEWSFRATPPWLRERYFTRRRDGLFELRLEIRRMVTFSYLNLADESYPSLATNTTAFDVVFCRNVLMYFAPGQIRTVAERLHRALCDGGWLFVSPSEMSQRLFAQFALAELDGALAYRKPARDGTRVERPLAALTHASQQAGAKPADARRAPLGRRDAAGPVAASRGAPAPFLALARREADEGRLDRALEWCEKALAADRLEPVAHYLHATIRLERGEREAAAHAFERALFLAPELVLAHVALGNLRMSERRRGEARWHFGNALAVLHKLPPEAPVPESGGLTAARMSEIVGSLRRSLVPESFPEERTA